MAEQFEALPPDVPERLKSQFHYYDSGSIRHLTRLQFYKTVQILAGVAIPIVSLSIVDPWTARISAAVLGAIVSAIEAHLQFRQYQQNWVRWRGSAEALRREAYLYAKKAGPYRDASDPETLLTERVEDIVSEEQQTWKSLHVKTESKKDP